MKIEAVVGARGAVGYLVSDRAGGSAIAVDVPYGTASLFLNAIGQGGLTLEYVVNTHGHWDQIGDNAALVKATGATLCAHSWDAARLSTPSLGTENPGERIPKLVGRSADRFLREGEELQVGNLTFTVWHTPGHTPGSLSFYEARAGALFSGDILVNSAVGRSDFPGGNGSLLLESLGRIATLPDSTQIFPGHGLTMILRNERWILELAKQTSA